MNPKHEILHGIGIEQKEKKMVEVEPIGPLCVIAMSTSVLGEWNFQARVVLKEKKLIEICDLVSDLTFLLINAELVQSMQIYKL